MGRLAGLLLAAGGLLALRAAQQPDLFKKAPPGVEEALKARVTAFWTAQVAAKWRAADQYVAEEAKDTYFGADKPNCRSWAYVAAIFEPDFNQAKVLITCETLFSHSGQRIPVKVPMTGFWKVIDGQWFWYIPPRDELVQTPFGMMKVDEEKSNTPTTGASQPVSFRIPKLEELQSRIQVSNKALELKSYQESSDEFTVRNGTGGNITLSLQSPGLAGLEFEIDKKELKDGETAKGVVKYKPAGRLDSPRIVLTLHVDPFNHEIPLTITFQLPPDAQRLLDRKK